MGYKIVFHSVLVMALLGLVGCGETAKLKIDIEDMRQQAENFQKQAAEQHAAAKKYAAIAEDAAARADKAESAASAEKTLIVLGLVGLFAGGTVILLMAGIGYRLLRTAPVHPAIIKTRDAAIRAACKATAPAPVAQQVSQTQTAI